MTRAVSCALMLLAVTNVSMAQAQSTNIPATPLLLLPGGTRAMGLGNAFVAGDGPEVLFYNPAQIGSSRGTALSAERFGSAAALGSLATSTTLLGASIGAGVQYLEYDTRHASGWTSVGDLAHGGPYQASSIMGLLGAAVSRKGIRIGLTTKFVQEQTPSGRTGMPAVDLGFASDVAGVTVGLAVLDADGLLAHRSPSAIRLPTRISLGGMISDQRLSTWFDIGAAASITVEQGGRFVPAGGVELTYVPVNGWSLVGRVGGHRVLGHDRGGESPLSLGATLEIDKLAVDYAFEPGNMHRVGVRIRP